MKLLKSLTIKIGILLVLIETVLFTILGIVYSYIYISQLQNDLEEKLQLPGKLISRGLLGYYSITDRDILREIIGADVLEAYIFGVNGHIFYSMDPGKTGLSLYEINDDTPLSLPAEGRTIIENQIYKGGESKSCLSPVYSFDKASSTLFSFIRVEIKTIAIKRMGIIRKFAIGFIGTIFLTIFSISLILKRYIYYGIDQSLLVLQQVEKGNLSSRIHISLRTVEMERLHQGINSMIGKLEERMNDLKFEISERKKAESQKMLAQNALMQSTKLADLGALSAGVAHEFRNPLAGLSMVTQILIQRLSDEKNARNREAARGAQIEFAQLTDYLESREIFIQLKSLDELTAKMNEIVDGMLSYSRKTTGEFTLTNIKSLISETLTLAKFNASFKQVAHIDLHVQNDLPDIRCLKSEMQQVLLNILGNGADAMNELKLKDRDYSPRFRIDVSLEGDFISITIEDNGPGIAASIRDTVFDPFFTTKDIGKGTGLGLYICRIIIEEKHKGSVSLEGGKETGCVFLIKIPVHPENDN